MRRLWADTESFELASHLRKLSLAIMSRTPSGVRAQGMNSINNSSAPVDGDRPPGRETVVLGQNDWLEKQHKG